MHLNEGISVIFAAISHHFQEGSRYFLGFPPFPSSNNPPEGTNCTLLGDTLRWNQLNLPPRNLNIQLHKIEPNNTQNIPGLLLVLELQHPHRSLALVQK